MIFHKIIPVHTIKA